MQPAWFDQELQDNLESIAHKTKVRAGQVLLGQEPSEQTRTFIILNGQLRLWAPPDMKLDAESHNILIDDVNAIDVVGEIGALFGQPSEVIVEAITDGDVYGIKNEEFSNLIDTHKGLRDHVIKNLCRHISIANHRLRDAYTLTSKARVIKQILLLTDFRSANGENSHIIKNFPRHNILAAKCGVTRETVSRALAVLIKKGVLERQGSTMIIHDYASLEDHYRELGGGPTS